MGDCESSSTVHTLGGISSSSGFPKYTPDFDWKFFKSLVENYFAINSVKDSESQKQLFLAYLPDELLNIVISLVGFQALANLSMTDIFEQLNSYFEAKVPESIRRRDFFRRDRRANETMSDYANALRTLVELCNFGDSTNEYLCSCFIAGLNQEMLQNLLKNLNGGSFDALVKRATALECTIGCDIRGGGDRNMFVKVENDEVSACEFKDMGCEFTGSAVEMKLHLMSSISKHLLQSNKFQQQKLEAENQEVECLKQKVDVLQRQAVDQKQQNDSSVVLLLEVEVTKQMIEALKQNIDVQNTSIGTQGADVFVLKEDLRSLKKTEFVWCITGVAAHIQTANARSSYRVHSKTFDTRKNGYCVSGTCAFNGRDTKPKRVALYLVLHPGPCDAILPWPFHQNVTFTLHQQLGSTLKDIKRSVVIGLEKWKAPLSEKSTGQGFPDFVTQDLLKQYVKDDQIYITITIEDL